MGAGRGSARPTPRTDRGSKPSGSARRRMRGRGGGRSAQVVGADF